MHTGRGPVDDPAWYAGTREYSGLRPAKNIHWKASARLGALQEKIYEPTYHRKVLFVFDAQSYTVLPKSEDEAAINLFDFRDAALRDYERMLETMGTLAAKLMESGASFGLVSDCSGTKPAPGITTLPAGRGPEQLGLFLETLARAKEPQISDFDSSPGPSRLSAVLREASFACTGLVYCGACPGEGAMSVLREAGRRKKILFIFSRDAKSFFEDRPACLACEMCFTEETK